MLKCENCKSYSLHEKCKCGGNAVNPMPPKYSPDDHYGDYRRKAKKELLIEKGLL